MSAEIELDTRLILGADLFGIHGTESAGAFLHGLSEKRFPETVFFVDGFGYQTPLVD